MRCYIQKDRANVSMNLGPYEISMAYWKQKPQDEACIHNHIQIYFNQINITDEVLVKLGISGPDYISTMDYMRILNYITLRIVDNQN